jgi:hypothetical protein
LIPFFLPSSPFLPFFFLFGSYWGLNSGLARYFLSQNVLSIIYSSSALAFFNLFFFKGLDQLLLSLALHPGMHITCYLNI